MPPSISPILNHDVIRAILESCDLFTLIVCRSVSQDFKRMVDEEVALEELDCSGLTLRQRRLITDAAITPSVIHLLRHATMVNVNGTSITHHGAKNLVTPILKELHIERCPRIDLGTLVGDIAGIKWTPSRIIPVSIFTRTRGILDYYTITKPLFDYSNDLIMLSKVCTCGYVNMAAPMGRPNQPVSIGCHTCGDRVNDGVRNLCLGCMLVTCDRCMIKACSNPTCTERVCKGCVSDQKCSLCSRVWCGLCDEDVTLSNCYGCDIRACSECRPSMTACSVCSNEYCGDCTGILTRMAENWCCEKPLASLKDHPLWTLSEGEMTWFEPDM